MSAPAGEMPLPDGRRAQDGSSGLRFHRACACHHLCVARRTKCDASGTPLGASSAHTRDFAHGRDDPHLPCPFSCEAKRRFTTPLLVFEDTCEHVDALGTTPPDALARQQTWFRLGFSRHSHPPSNPTLDAPPGAPLMPRPPHNLGAIGAQAQANCPSALILNMGSPRAGFSYA